MFQLARMGVDEVAAKAPLPAAAKAMLDVGGSHGLYSVAFCRAINTESRVRHRAGNILEDDLGDLRR
jgi:hypothetical protein